MRLILLLLTCSVFWFPANAQPLKCYINTLASNIPGQHATYEMKKVGNYLYASGSITYCGLEYGIFTKFTIDGKFIWSVHLPIPSIVASFTSNNGQFFLCGNTTPTDAFNASFVAKVDDNGVLQWVKKIDHDGREVPRHIVYHPNPGANNAHLYMVSQVAFAGMLDDTRLTNLDENGKINWEFDYGTTTVDDECAYGLVIMPNKNLLLLGLYSTNRVGSAFMEVGPNGEFIGYNTINTNNFTNITTYDVAVQPNTNNLLLAGKYSADEGIIICVDVISKAVKWTMRLPSSKGGIFSIDVNNRGDVFTLSSNAIQSPILSKITLQNGEGKFQYSKQYFEKGDVFGRFPQVVVTDTTLFLVDSRRLQMQPEFQNTNQIILGVNSILSPVCCEYNVETNQPEQPLLVSDNILADVRVPEIIKEEVQYSYFSIFFNSTTECSAFVGITEDLKHEKDRWMQVTPTLSNTFFKFILLHAELPLCKINISDQLGNIVSTILIDKGNSEGIITLPNSPAGCYYVMLFSETGELVDYEKIIKY